MLEAFAVVGSIRGVTMGHVDGGVVVAMSHALVDLQSKLRGRRRGGGGNNNRMSATRQMQAFRDGIVDGGLLTKCLTAIAVLGVKGRKVGEEGWREYEERRESLKGGAQVDHDQDEEGGKEKEEKVDEMMVDKPFSAPPVSVIEEKVNLVKCCFKQLEKINAVIMRERTQGEDESSPSSIPSSSSSSSFIELFPTVVARIMSDLSSTFTKEDDDGNPYYPREYDDVGDEVDALLSRCYEYLHDGLEIVVIKENKPDAREGGWWPPEDREAAIALYDLVSRVKFHGNRKSSTFHQAYEVVSEGLGSFTPTPIEESIETYVFTGSCQPFVETKSVGALEGVILPSCCFR
jgi:hypothetical protein